jgi:ABC-type multidrug transport system fused ATPase/permease subunit
MLILKTLPDSSKKHIWSYIQYYYNVKKNVFLSLFLTIIQAVSLIPVAILIQYTFDHSIPEKNGKQLVAILTIVFFLFILNALAILVNRHLTLTVVKSVIHSMRKDLIERSIFFSHQFFTNEDLDKVHSKIVHDSERLDSMTTNLLLQFIPGILIFTGLSGLLIYLNAFLFAVVFAVIPMLFIMGNFINKKLKIVAREFHSDYSEFSKGILFVLRFNELIKLSTAEKKELEKQDKIIEKLKSSGHKIAWLSTAHNVMQTNLLTLSGVVVLLVGGFQVIYNHITLGELLSFYVALGLLSTNMKSVIFTIPVIIEGMESVSKLMPLMDHKTSVKESVNQFKGFQHTIRFEDVHFNYSSDFELNGINFTLNKNDITGIFGASGSGKSTIINLLLGFYQPKQGNIFYDNHNINDVNLIDYRKNIGVLLQDPLIFPGTIRENLVYGLPDIDNAKIIEICNLCKIHSFINGLEKGYDSEIGERGIKISGGQKQRIAIARALLREPILLILDEPDNNLDEKLIFEIISNIRELKITLLIISHNKSLYTYLDKVYEFKDNILIESVDKLILKKELI